MARCGCGACTGRGRGGAAAAVAGLAVLGYTALGALLFAALEGGAQEAVAASQPAAASLRARAVDRLWAITEDLNILYRDNWTRLAARELRDFERALAAAARHPPPQPHPAHSKWTFAGSFLYALTLITTIGPGPGWAVSGAGRAAGAVYAAGGLPLVLVYLAAAGGAGARALRAGWAALTARTLPRPPPAPPDKRAPPPTPFQAALNLSALPPRTCRPPPRAPAALGAVLVALYVLLGAAMFRATERWSLLDGCYFSFACLATIGFGELEPGRYASTVSPRAEDLAVGACCAYILVGIAVVAMCFDLMQEEIVAALRGLAARTSGSARVGLGAVADAERSSPALAPLEPS